MKLLTLPVAALGLSLLLGTAATDADAATKRRATASKSARKAVRPAAAAAVGLPAAGAAQLVAAQNTLVGGYQCELSQSINVENNLKNPGYIDVRHGSKTMTMKPVLSPTGALRLEDVSGRHLMLQIADKSMLMDVKEGRRLVDGCVHPAQRTAAAAATASPVATAPAVVAPAAAPASAPSGTTVVVQPLPAAELQQQPAAAPVQSPVPAAAQ